MVLCQRNRKYDDFFNLLLYVALLLLTKDQPQLIKKRVQDLLTKLYNILIFKYFGYDDFAKRNSWAEV